MKISGDWLHNSATQAVFAALQQAGYRALLVGGCVRNALLGTAVSDIDMATDAQPDQVAALAAVAGLRVVPTGIAHGTVTVISKGIPHEITTFRRDIATDGRHATIAFSTRIEEDAARRDFTMNALYAEADGSVVDPLGGLPDLQAHRIRFVGSAPDRIREDYLRILRFFRFHAWYGAPDQGLDPAALAAIAENTDGLAALSRERIGHEMRKLLAAPDPAPALAAMQATGTLAAVLPGSDPRAIAPLVHFEGEIPPDWPRRLAALTATEAIAGDLRLSRSEAKALARIRAALAQPLAEATWRHGPDAARDATLILAASTGSPPPQDWQHTIEQAKAARFPLSAADLPTTLTGSAIGTTLRQLETLWLRSNFKATREDLLATL